jgi:hypothetical protein
MALPNRMSLHQGLLWLTLNLALIIQGLLQNNIYVFHSYTPHEMYSRTLGDTLPHAEDHCSVGTEKNHGWYKLGDSSWRPCRITTAKSRWSVAGLCRCSLHVSHKHRNTMKSKLSFMKPFWESAKETPHIQSHKMKVRGQFHALITLSTVPIITSLTDHSLEPVWNK